MNGAELRTTRQCWHGQRTDFGTGLKKRIFASKGLWGVASA